MHIYFVIYTFERGTITYVRGGSADSCVERELIVSRALFLYINHALQGNSTAIPFKMQIKIKREIIKIIESNTGIEVPYLNEKGHFTFAYEVLESLAQGYLITHVDKGGYFPLSILHYYLAELSKEIGLGKEDSHYELAYDYYRKGGGSLDRDGMIKLIEDLSM